MTAKKKGPIRLDQITPEEKMKYEVAEELGLLDKVLAEGWKSLSSKGREAGRTQASAAAKRCGRGVKVTKVLRMLISMNIYRESLKTESPFAIIEKLD